MAEQDGGIDVNNSSLRANDVVGHDKITNITISNLPKYKLGYTPPLPSLIVGRDNDLDELKTRLGISGYQRLDNKESLVVVRGWPGVGKTTIASALSHDPEIARTFPDGVLWVSLTEKPKIISKLAEWGRALGTDYVLRAKTVEEASVQLSAQLSDKQMLLIVDDVWQAEHAIPFKVGGRGCGTLITTRANDIANSLAPTPNDIFLLHGLPDDIALEFINTLAPKIAEKYPQETLKLVKAYEGLPLALKVAGGLLHAEMIKGFDIKKLLIELCEGIKLIEAKAPSDRTNLADETTPTIKALLSKSTDHLESKVRDCFAYLCVFASKPATFDLNAIAAIWKIDDPKPIVGQLVDRGLLEYAEGRYHIHGLLVDHALSLFNG